MTEPTLDAPPAHDSLRPHSLRLGRGLLVLGKRERRLRQIRAAGWGLLGGSVALFLLFVARAYAKGRWGIDLLPASRWTIAAYSVVGLTLVVGGAWTVALLRGRSIDAFARRMDGRLEFDDLLAAGRSASTLGGPVAREVERRAADAVDRLRPDELFPARRSIAALAAVVPLFLTGIYVTELPPPKGGPLPLPVEDPQGSAGAVGGGVAGESPAEEGDAGEETGTEGSGEGEAGGPVEPVDVFGVRVVPEKDPFSPEDLVTLHILANPEAPAARGHEYDLTLVIDGQPFPADHRMAIPAGTDGALESIYAKLLPGAAEKLTPGKHTVVAVLTEGEHKLASDPVEIEIEQNDGPGGGGGEKPKQKPKPKPEPQPQPGAPPPPPEVKVKDKFVNPLFREGEMEKKKGWALVPDPDAPPGTPPRRVPLEEIAREMEKRPESEVPVERVRESDREIVRRYFELLKDAGK